MSVFWVISSDNIRVLDPVKERVWFAWGRKCSLERQSGWLEEDEAREECDSNEHCCQATSDPTCFCDDSSSWILSLLNFLFLCSYKYLVFCQDRIAVELGRYLLDVAFSI